MRSEDQPRPDLDAAVDAVAAALTAVDDDTVAASLRRTRVALADGHAGVRAVPAWRWRLAGAAAFSIVLVAVAVWRRAEGPVVEIASTPRPTAPVVATAPGEAPPVPARSAPASASGPRVARSEPAPRVAPRPVERVRATSAAGPEPARRADPLSSLVAAVQAIPEDAWARGSAPTDVAPSDFSVAPIPIDPLEVPAIADAPAEPIAPGEP